MKKATKANINKLNGIVSDTCISIFVPLHGGVSNHIKDEIAVKHVITTLQDKLDRIDDARAKHSTRRIISELQKALLGRKNITLCLFDDLNKLTVLYIAAEIEEQVYVSDTFAAHILEEHMAVSSPYYVLTLSQSAAHLFLADNSSLKIQHKFSATADVEPLLKELRIDELNTQVNTHPSGMGGTKGSHGFHGFGSLKDQRKELIADYFRKIDAKILPVVKKRGLPLLLAGVGYLLPVYRRVTKYDNIAPNELHGNMDKVSDKKLFELVKPLISAVQAAA